MPALALILAAIFILPLVTTAVGAFVGGIVGMVFPETMSLMLTALGLKAAAPWQFGAMCGFVGGFFKSSSK